MNAIPQNAISNLELLKNEDWHLVRDIFLPIIRPEKGSNENNFEADIENAVAYVGMPSGLRLYDPSEPETFNRLSSIFTKVLPYLERGEDHFRLEQEGLAFRAQVGNLPGKIDLMLRALPQEAPRLADLNLPFAWKALMMDQEILNGGLILICAPNGQGKTTTASAIIRSRLEQYAGFCNTCEDPPEIPLAGFWGQGQCVQRPVTVHGVDGAVGSYYQSLEKTLRQFPAFTGGGTILFVGEIRDNETAAATLKAAGNGHLVIATVHAQSITLAMRRMVTLASGSKDNMDADSVREMMSEVLRGVFYQRLAWEKDNNKNLRGWDRAEVKGDMLWITGYNTQAAQALRNNQTSALAEIVKKQTQWSRAITKEQVASTVKAGMPGTDEAR
jgi:Tfp pilus assembly pilus retraction ATPase PilT